VVSVVSVVQNSLFFWLGVSVLKDFHHRGK
jgi:hypothetical protein